MYDYFIVVDNELTDLQESNIFCSRRMRRSSTQYSKLLSTATDVKTYKSIFWDWIGWSREHDIFFWYTDESDDIRIFMNLADLEDSYFDRFSSGNTKVPSTLRVSSTDTPSNVLLDAGGDSFSVFKRNPRNYEKEMQNE